SIENLTRPAAKINRIDRAKIVWIMPLRASRGKRRLKGSGNCRPNPSFSLRDPRAADIVSRSFRQNFDTLMDIIPSVARVRVEPNDGSAASGTNGGIKARGDDAAGIIDDSEPRIFFCQLRKNAPCPII